ncbi:capsule biosynthesis phosphatase [Flexibacter flexilis DSM 6793]|uniref:Capsule biosynthesis phosphatase n=1 Tax=Flexibacter flexilis DSM 6793 TaxID=927664 RepID=A0A1I1FJK6_9BACT|nr:HAD hydrolase family protein [Flexibacter flexilis]SFB99525.1 capsule biosynthesis phosphatase [Flexibacter flexilis DSM 6793]
MRIVIDLDGTLCPIRQKHEKYAELPPLPHAVERMKELKAQGHYLIISTARNMATCEANVGKVMKNVGKITLEWLDKHDIPYDEIFFGKPNAELYIDDRALRFHSWAEVTDELLEDLRKEK